MKKNTVSILLSSFSCQILCGNVDVLLPGQVGVKLWSFCRSAETTFDQEWVLVFKTLFKKTCGWKPQLLWNRQNGWKEARRAQSKMSG